MRMAELRQLPRGKNIWLRTARGGHNTEFWGVKKGRVYVYDVLYNLGEKLVHVDPNDIYLEKPKMVRVKVKK